MLTRIAPTITGTSLCPKWSRQIYAYRAYGPFDPERGLRFDPAKVLLDPYGRASSCPMDTLATPRADTANRHERHEERGRRSRCLRLGGRRTVAPALRQTMIYEMHVAGFTQHPSSGVAPERRGTYAGMIEKIPYLQDLGITAVELFRYSSSIGRTVRRAWSTTGGIPRSRSLLLTRATVHEGRARSRRRVPRSRQGAPPRRYRGDTRCCLQPYRRGE